MAASISAPFSTPEYATQQFLEPERRSSETLAMAARVAELYSDTAQSSARGSWLGLANTESVTNPPRQHSPQPPAMASYQLRSVPEAPSAAAPVLAAAIIRRKPVPYRPLRSNPFVMASPVASNPSVFSSQSSQSAMSPPSQASFTYQGTTDSSHERWAQDQESPYQHRTTPPPQWETPDDVGSGSGSGQHLGQDYFWNSTSTQPTQNSGENVRSAESITFTADYNGVQAGHRPPLKSKRSTMFGMKNTLDYGKNKLGKAKQLSNGVLARRQTGL